MITSFGLCNEANSETDRSIVNREIVNLLTL